MHKQLVIEQITNEFPNARPESSEDRILTKLPTGELIIDLRPEGVVMSYYCYDSQPIRDVLASAEWSQYCATLNDISRCLRLVSARRSVSKTADSISVLVLAKDQVSVDPQTVAVSMPQRSRLLAALAGNNQYQGYVLRVAGTIPTKVEVEHERELLAEAWILVTDRDSAPFQVANVTQYPSIICKLTTQVDGRDLWHSRTSLIQLIGDLGSALSVTV